MWSVFHWGRIFLTVQNDSYGERNIHGSVDSEVDISTKFASQDLWYIMDEMLFFQPDIGQILIVVSTSFVIVAYH